MTQPYTIRRATLDDLATIAHQRAGMFTDMGTDPAKIQAWDAPFRLWLAERLASGEYLGWLAVAPSGEIVSGAGMLLHDWIPSPLTTGTRRGYVLNVFTEPPHRRQGLARLLVDECIAYCRANGIPTVVLHASDAGRPIYDAMGFKSSSEMRMKLE